MNKKSGMGMVQVYTGDGKGKTTAALGLVLRAVGKGYRAIVIQFMKGNIKYGELKGIGHLPGAQIEQYGRPDFVNRDNPEQIDIDLARHGFQRAKEVINSGEYDLVVLDEMNITLDYKLLDMAEVLDVIRSRPDGVEIVLTGRYAPAEVMEMADLVTVMDEWKHPYASGVEAREGIEY